MVKLRAGGQKVARERTGSGPHFNQRKGIGSFEDLVKLVDLARQRQCKHGVDIAAGVEIAVPTDLVLARSSTHIISMCRLVERELHEPGEGDRPGRLDFLGNLRHQVRMTLGYRIPHGQTPTLLRFASGPTLAVDCPASQAQ